MLSGIGSQLHNGELVLCDVSRLNDGGHKTCDIVTRQAREHQLVWASTRAHNLSSIAYAQRYTLTQTYLDRWIQV